ncbi:hypothetical protein ACAG26_11355 [Mycobacterium sp. pUA109]|uniref:hypothetical protein n=1 Tax=Mycobacterium sp. pUA109 TaxID=3238982 RepID=UPI00351B127F
MPAQQGRRSAIRELFAATTIGLLTGVVACSVAPSAKGLPGHRPSIEAPPSQKPDITQLTESMLVDQSSFPNIPGSKFVRSISGNTVDVEVSPSECSPLVVGDSTPQSGYAGVVGVGGMDVHLTVTSDPPDIRTLLDNCGTVSGSGPTVPLVTWHITPIDVAGVPSWAGAVDMSGNATVFGTYRGVFVKSNADRDRENDAVKVFNDQVAKLAAV